MHLSMLSDWLRVKWCSLMDLSLAPGWDWLLLRPFMALPSSRERLVVNLRTERGRRARVVYPDPARNADDAELMGTLEAIEYERAQRHG